MTRPQLLSSAPVLASRDFDRTAQFHAQFGFHEVARYAEGYLILRCDGAELHFFQEGPEFDPSDAPSTYIRVLNVTRAQAAWSKLGLPIDGTPGYRPFSLRPWGMIEAYVVDPDGNHLTYGTPNEIVPEDTPA